MEFIPQPNLAPFQKKKNLWPSFFLIIDFKKTSYMLIVSQKPST